MAFVLSRANIILRGPQGQTHRLHMGEIGTVPSWAEKTPYYADLLRAGKIVAVSGKKDVQVEAEIEEAEAKEKAQTEAVIEEATAEEPKKKRSKK